MSYHPGEIVEYYSSEDLYERHVEDAERGLEEKEREVIDRYFAEGGTILDIGCGTGRTTKALDGLGYDVVGVDITKPYVDYATSTFPTISFGVGDATALPFADESFEHVIFSFNGIDVLSPPRIRLRALREIHRVLEPGGIFAFSTHNPLHMLTFFPPTPRSIEATLKFWVINWRENRLGSNYKLDNQIQGGPIPIYFIRPGEQRRQLRECGFEPLDLVGDTVFLPARLDPHPYHVAYKPSTCPPREVSSTCPPRE